VFAPLLAQRSFRWLWLGQSASMLGDRMVMVALALFLTRDGGGAGEVGVALAAYTVPLVLFLLIGGVWADRLPRHRIMIVTDVVRAALHAVLAGLIFAGEARLGFIVAIGVVFGTAEAFFRPAYVALIPQTVPEELIQPANGLSQTSGNAAVFAGPALATALVAGPGAGWAFAVDAATFVASAAFLLAVRPRERGARGVRASMIAELVEGLQEVRQRSWVWVTIAVFTLCLLTGLAPWFVLGPSVADDRYGSTTVFGVVAAVFGAGTLGGSLAGLRWRPRRPMRTAFLWILGWPVMNALFALGAPRSALYPVAAAAGVGWALFGIWWETALAERIPPHLLSRVSAWDWMGSLALLPAGYIVAGFLGDALGAAPVLLVGAALTATALALGLLPRQTRELARTEPGYSGVT